jgi:hypothetical protein
MEPRLPDPRNADIVIYVGGELLPRDAAKGKACAFITTKYFNWMPI